MKPAIEFESAHGCRIYLCTVMSVNEVKRKQAVEAFVVKGTGPPSSRTFAVADEDHTLGNALRHVLIQNEAVSFAGYSVPHPSEPLYRFEFRQLMLLA